MTRIHDLQDTATTTEQFTEAELKGLLSAMFSGHVTEFEYRGLTVFKRPKSNSFWVADAEEGTAYGEMLVKGCPIEGTLDWIEAKADLYGEPT